MKWCRIVDPLVVQSNHGRDKIKNKEENNIITSLFLLHGGRFYSNDSSVKYGEMRCSVKQVSVISFYSLQPIELW